MQQLFWFRDAMAIYCSRRSMLRLWKQFCKRRAQEERSTQSHMYSVLEAGGGGGGARGCRRTNIRANLNMGLTSLTNQR
jgi:hypothetical protein